MSGFDANRVYSVSVHEPPAFTTPETASEVEKLLLDFLLQFRVAGEYIYRQVSTVALEESLMTRARRDTLRANLLLKQHQLEVDLRHVGLYNDELAHSIQDAPADILPLVSAYMLTVSLRV
jgi:DNA replication licensing factor MCM5